MTGATGPNVSSCAIRMSGVTPVSTVAGIEESFLRPVLFDVGAFRAGVLDVVDDALERVRVAERPHLGLIERRVADPQDRGARLQLLDELIVDVLVDDAAARPTCTPDRRSRSIRSSHRRPRRRCRRRAG